METPRGLTPPVVSLTYDGSRMSHLEIVLPQLKEFGFKATFYAEPTSLLDDYPSWRAAHEQGHEIGNGTLLSSALEDGSLPAWTPQMLLDDLDEANDLLKELFPGQVKHSIGLPWGDGTCAGGVPYGPFLARAYEVVRSGNVGFNFSGATSVNALSHIAAEDLSGRELIEIVKRGIYEDAWTVIALDGVGSGERSIDAAAHRELLEFLDSNKTLVKVIPVIDMALDYFLQPSSRASIH
ncbi:polysaccharide deacetylase family protein [Kamptonema cortianum]|nr:polysaccharide deacetylase family protein [Geitlerinema splendidum]MDK3157633.1 polysaccharide deacetylase family protein [Kamptonema cortianum]